MIVVDETGFLPFAGKIAVSDKAGRFCIFDDNEGIRTEVPVNVRDAGYDETSGGAVYILDFSTLSDPGIYHVESEEGDRSVSFAVQPDAYKTLKNALLKFFYFQRCGFELEEKYAGPYARKACHPGIVRIYRSDDTIDVHKGWHDAGDYGRYVSAGAVAAAHLLYAYELFPKAFEDGVNIPESGNGLPDVLNECRYELEFIKDMQSSDGGVHHKATSEVFCGYIMPHEDDKDMLAFPVTSLSTADFAACLCIASRVYEKYDPAFAKECLSKAHRAGGWLLSQEDNTDFHNPPGVITGEYTDTSDRDERMWAYAELLKTDLSVDEKHAYAKKLREMLDSYKESHPHADGRSVDDGFGWQDVSSLAILSVLSDTKGIFDRALRDEMEGMLYERADAFADMQKTGWPVSMKREDFVWGSNMIVSNRAAILAIAAMNLAGRIGGGGSVPGDPDKIKTRIASYEEAYANQIHYILGMNAMDVSYVTGFGEHAVGDPHNRVTVADGIEKAIPGELTGGPCTLFADEEIAKRLDHDTSPQKCYLDDHRSYSTNEIAVYWNSTLLFSVAYALKD